ncbi:AT hook domain-containing protein [Ceratocystis lukuohia]|uniref:AT hook domain-containing protein n=1 Tax=Ceratocystis lukuohia TaxID=2019550 RepID=A0ABR4ML13_9PEZI
MATRAERMQQRLRGAQRHQVEDLEFGSLFPTESFPVATLHEPAPEPESQESSSPEPEPSITPPPRIDTAAKAAEPALTEEETRETEPLSVQPQHPSPPRQSPPLRRSPRNKSVTPSALDEQPELPPHPSNSVIIDEVTESPTDAPGSGHRQRRIERVALHSSGAGLQHVLDDLDSGAVAVAMLNSSSPLTRKSRMASRQRTRLSRASRLSRITGAVAEESEAVDELSPDADRIRRVSNVEIPASPEMLPVADDTEPTTTARVDYPDEEEAEAIADEEAAQVLSRNKRLRDESPELLLSEPPQRISSPSIPQYSEVPEAQLSPSPSPTPELVDLQPPQKRSRRTQAQSLSPSQSQSQSQAQLPPKPRSKAPKARKTQPENVFNRFSNLDKKTTIPIAVQRFSAPSKASQESDKDGDSTMIAISKIPCTSRSGVNTIDVLSQVCEEVLDNSIAQLLAAAESADASVAGPHAKKEYKAKIRALEAFQQELRSRLLQHTIHVDALHTLKKRVRRAAADKARLRAQVLQLRAEKDQLALRMDAARDMHDTNTRDLHARLDMSAAMHAVESVLDRGAMSSDLPPAEARDAELANLELVVATVAEQASSRGPGGGALNQIREFNRFLERAAHALESR